MSNQPEQRFDIQRIYTKNISLESPNSPDVFKNMQNPDISVQLSNDSENLEGDIFEVRLRVTLTAEYGEKKTMFLAEVEQAGIFELGGFTDEQLEHMKGAYCPNILFPYVRETLDNLVVRAGFPPVILAPINFDAIFAHRQAQLAEEAANSAETDA
ncbi:protein-export chaperone SecB [Ignatzschineria sp. RMDPL8A]|uniref:protein-export chaperone SecB n=1 Tax=Ignatzschineria sp. RMDPL8A TaxID=2999236 RepID=UPI00244666FF|nr:protein-export chaperone SecB [Ignatzschineria sp. RMDPL8A]MDG9729169.1 protein-export chaperone SecB [Ignatzschineria sp. RMDPL8A]